MVDAIRFLIVEDDPMISMMVETLLEELGHDVAGIAETSGAALGLIVGGGMDAAIIDVNLGENETSEAVAEALADRDIPFIVSSGSLSNAPAFVGRPHLAKPYSMDRMRQAIAALV